MAKLANYMLADIKKNTVDFQPNFDEERQEPVVLPSRFPNLLVNGSSGIAVGMATNIPPHNLAEVIDGTCYVIDHPEAEMDEICQFIKGPDFPTGGVIMGPQRHPRCLCNRPRQDQSPRKDRNCRSAERQEPNRYYRNPVHGKQGASGRVHGKSRQG